jgi:hypothetical protein
MNQEEQNNAEARQAAEGTLQQQHELHVELVKDDSDGQHSKVNPFVEAALRQQASNGASYIRPEMDQELHVLVESGEDRKARTGSWYEALALKDTNTGDLYQANIFVDNDSQTCLLVTAYMAFAGDAPKGYTGWFDLLQGMTATVTFSETSNGFYKLATVTFDSLEG